MIGTPRVRRAAGVAALAVPLLATACMPLPFLYAGGVAGRVVDESSGAPVADAVVVVRVDARYDELLPDRDLVGHREAVTDADGRFRTDPIWKAGLSMWPLVRTETRVVGVMREGYRCPRPAAVNRARPLAIGLSPALDAEDRRGSCRPVTATPREAPRYLAAWNALFPPEITPEQREREQQLHRLLEARSAFGFGANCEGPIADLALAPEGGIAAYLDRSAGQVEVLALRRGAPRLARVALPAGAGEAGRADTRRLAWTGPDELVLWEPADRRDRVGSLSVLSAAGEAPQVIWSGRTPSASGEFAAARASRRPLDPADLNDAGDARWLGRSFALRRGIHPESGLGSDHLRIAEPDGQVREIPLPGEPCGPRARFGRPQHRIAADGRTALDLRYVEGGCHALAIDLETGAFVVLDGAREPGSCREWRRIPASELALAMRGYAREVEQALAVAGADPGAAFALELDGAGTARAISRSFEGEARSAELPPFPLATPLRRIEVSVLGGGARSIPPSGSELEPL